MLLEKVHKVIYEIRGHKVMLDFNLAELYEVETKALNQAVKRNIERFPEDFMFRLSSKEWEIIRSQFVTASQSKRNISQPPLAFTEQGVAMLSGVLK
jgi:ORF6N domain